jgi:hypothetical protein
LVFAPPRLSVTAAQPMWRWLGVRLGVPAIVVVTIMVVGGIITHNAGLIGAAFIVVGIAAAILGVEVPLLLRAIRRRQERLLASSPAGTLFAARATHVNPANGIARASAQSRHGLDRGLLRIDQTGATFAPDRPPSPPISIGWDQVDRIDITPRTQLIAGLELVGASRQTEYWRVPGMRQLIGTLTQLQEQWSDGTDLLP